MDRPKLHPHRKFRPNPLRRPWISGPPAGSRLRFVVAVVAAGVLSAVVACEAPPPEAPDPSPDSGSAAFDAPESASTSAPTPPAASYVPPPRVRPSEPLDPGLDPVWARKDPAELGMDPVRLGEAVEYALGHETRQIPQDPGAYLRDRFAGLPDQEIVGPTKDRGGVNGLVLKDGYIVAEFGDTDREDMTFSVTKSYLSTVAGLAGAEGLVPDLDEPVGATVRDPAFQGPRNGAIAWRHLLTQTSEWEGTLFGKPDTADRREGVDRTLQEPGTFWEYNDVRVNLLAYALLLRWERPLPQILAEKVMDPIGASPDWRWYGYRTSQVDVGGVRVSSVSGGGHWGGGLVIDTRDHARFGLLALREGVWAGRRILPRDWFRLATAPVEIKPEYGFMWWLNTDRALLPAAPESAFMAVGAGWSNVIYVDRENDLVTVTRWLDGAEHVNGFLARVLASMDAEPTS